MDNQAITHALFDALDARDFETFASMFAKEAVIWHNFDQRETSVAETAAILRDFRSLMKTSRYEDRRYLAIPGGAVAQHVLRAVTTEGRNVELCAMMRLFIENGRIRRIEEYFDPAQGAIIAQSLNSGILERKA